MLKKSYLYINVIFSSWSYLCQEALDDFLSTMQQEMEVSTLLFFFLNQVFQLTLQLPKYVTIVVIDMDSCSKILVNWLRSTLSMEFLKLCRTNLPDHEQGQVFVFYVTQRNLVQSDAIIQVIYRFYENSFTLISPLSPSLPSLFPSFFPLLFLFTSLFLFINTFLAAAGEGRTQRRGRVQPQ